MSYEYDKEDLNDCETRTTPIYEVSGSELELLSAVHSNLGDVTESLIENDVSRVEMLPGEEILLTFKQPPGGTAPQYLFVSSGYYLFDSVFFDGLWQSDGGSWGRI